jgi:hypothetical protein
MARLKVGRPDVTPDGPAHVSGVGQGNSKGNYESTPGMLPDGRRTAESVTGIAPKSHGPIDRRMPCLPPA